MTKLTKMLLGSAIFASASFSALEYGLAKDIITNSGVQPIVAISKKTEKLDHLVSLEYKDITHSDLEWRDIGKGLCFAEVDISKKGELIDRIAIVKIDPKFNEIRAFSGYDEKTEKYSDGTIEEWQRTTGAAVIINSAQYQANPWARPCALMICDGKLKGPKTNKSVRGMFLAEPKSNSLPLTDILDSQFDNINPEIYQQYNQGVQHWPILLNREGQIKVHQSDWQANRTAIGKDKNGNVLFMTTEGSFFTLHNYARMLKELSNEGLNIHTVMALDGGYEACMAIRTSDFNYTTYGQFETYGPDKDESIQNARCLLPGVIGAFPRR